MSTFNRENLPVGTVLLDRKVRIVMPYPNLSTQEIEEITGRTGTCKWDAIDSDGDIFVELDTPIARSGRTTSYVREWEFLDGNTQPDFIAAGTIRDGEVVDKTPAEEKLEALIDAVYAGAERHGYRSFLAGVMQEAGLPMRDGKRRLTLRGQRVVSPYDISEVSAALDRLAIGGKPVDAEVFVNRVIAEYCVTVPWPEAEGERHNCTALTGAMQDDYTQIPDDVLQKAALAVGLRGNVVTLRTHLANQYKIAPSYGASVSCAYCG